MKTIVFDNLIEANPKSNNFGNVIKIDVDQLNKRQYDAIAQRASAFGKRFVECSKNS